MTRYFLLLLIHLLPLLIFSSDYTHRLQLNVTVAKSYFDSTGVTMVPISGSQNVLVEVIDVILDQPIWSLSEEMVIDGGHISVLIQDEMLDWVELLQEKDLMFRVTVLDDIIDIPFEFLPFATLSDFTDRARYFKDDSLIRIDYENSKVIVNGATLNANLAVSGSIHADYLVGDGSELTNLTGPGFNDEHSLNSENGIYKDVLFVDSTGNVGIHTPTPSARLHIKGNTVFRGNFDSQVSNYIVPSGSILLWDPDRSAFRSGIFSERTMSEDIGYYSVAFGEDVIVKSYYSAILGGEDHVIDSNSSVIIGGQEHSILNNYSVIVGGYKNYVGGEWSVVFGGRNHNVYGDYNVLLGGGDNEVRGALNTIVGRNNMVFSDYAIVLGSYHIVSSNQSIALGKGAHIEHPNSIIYSDGMATIKSQKPEQMVVQASNGVGINKAPVSGHMLSVSGNIRARYFIGDGRYLTNINSDQDFWQQKNINTNVSDKGIYFMDGPVSVETITSKSSLTVSGGILIQGADQASNGTLSYDNGLKFYHNDWISVDQVDTDTQLTAGNGVRIDNQRISLAPLGAEPSNALYFNGTAWAAKHTVIWTPYSKGMFLPKSLGLLDDSISSLKAALVIKEPPATGAETTYPLVVGLTDSLRFNPLDNVILMNLDYSDSTKTGYKMVDSQPRQSMGDGYGGLLIVENQQFKIKQSDKAYKGGETVQLKSLVNLTPTSMVLHSDVSQTAFDSKGSISFVSTFIDHKDGVGFGHKAHVWNRYPNYLFFDSQFNLNVMAGDDSTSQPIHFKVGGQDKAMFNSNGELIVGVGSANAKLSVFGGGVAFNVDGAQVGSAMSYGKRATLSSVSLSDASIHMHMNDQIMADIGDLSMAIGTQNTSVISLLAYSKNNPQLDLRASNKSNLFLENESSIFMLENLDGIFSIKTVGSGSPILTLDSNEHLSLLTDTLSAQSEKEVVINGDIEISNTGELKFMTLNKDPIADLSKSGNTLTLQHKNNEPIRFQTVDGSDILVISANRTMAINSLTVTENASVYVVGDVLFNDPIYYEHVNAKRLIQAFVVDKVSTDATNKLEVRSVKSLRIDEESGIGLSIDDDGDTITMSSPGYYRKIYETPWLDGFDPDPLNPPQSIEPAGKDIIEFKEVLPNGGVSINLLDTNGDGNKDSIELYNPLIDGGVIEGTITLNGQLFINGTNADGSRVSAIPFQWLKKHGKLYYSSGNVGINTMSPNHRLDVDAVMGADRFTVSDRLWAQRIDFENSTATTVNNQVLFSVDADNNGVDDRFVFNSNSGSLLSMISDGSDQKIGVFTNDPQALVHVKKSGQVASILFESASSGVAGIQLNNSSTEKGVVIQLNNSTNDNPLVGRPNESVIIASSNITLHTNEQPAVYITDSYVSINQNYAKNAFYAGGSVTVGNNFAGTLSNPSAHGLTVQETMSVGHQSNTSTGATFYSKDNLRVGSIDIPDPTSFKGVIVQNKVGVGVQQPKDGLSIKGGLKIKDTLTMYYGDGTYQGFLIDPDDFAVVPSDASLDFRISKELSFDVANNRAMTVHDNSVTIGSDVVKDDHSNLYLYDGAGSEAKLFLDNVGAIFPEIVFSVNNGTHTGRIGIKASEIAIESNGANLDNPDIQIQSGKVGIGKAPGETLDVNGVVKVENLYKAGNRMYPVPDGVIVMWAGSEADIPSGWALCDGTGDRPNLLNKFIKGTASSIGTTGGENSKTVTSGDHTHGGGDHVHSVAGGPHTHGVSTTAASFHSMASVSISLSANVYGYPGAGTMQKSANNHNHTLGSSHSHSTSGQGDGGEHHVQHANTPGTHDHTGGVHTHDWNNEPAYYVLAYIIKIGDM